MPTWRQRSPIGVPASACCKTAVICSTEKRFFFTARPPGPRARLCRDTRSHIELRNREPLIRPRRADNASRITLVLLSWLVEWRDLRTIVRPYTFTCWHGELFARRGAP